MASQRSFFVSRQRWACTAFGISLVFLTGCSGGGGSVAGRQTVYSVKGKVLYNGQPVPNAQVSFLPEDEGMPPAIGPTSSDGSFVLTTYQQGDGAVAGPHQVKVTSLEQQTAPPIDVDFSDPDAYAKAMADRYAQGVDSPIKEHKSLIPERYGKFSSSGLIARVTEGGGNEFEFNLED